MRTLILIAIGLVVAGLSLWLSKPAWRVYVAGGFTLVWLAVVVWNLRTGLSHGYTLQQELPIHALIFSVPVVLAGWLAWKGSGQ